MRTKLLLLSCLIIALPASAANSGTLLLKSIVPGVFSLSVDPKPLASALPLQTSQANSDVGTVKIKANTSVGYKINISSVNSGQLLHSSNTGATIPYTLRFDARPVNLVAPVTLNYPAPQPNANNAKVEISYTGVPHENLQEGDYADTVTFTISSL